MMDWFISDWKTVGGIFVSVLLVYAALVVIIRINGIRSFSKMSGHDFAVTVAIGSIFASTVLSKEPAVLNAVIAIIALLSIQTILSKIRIATSNTYLENKPLLLMDGNKILYDNLKKANISHSDVISKLREANALNFDDVHAVIIKSTGDISVLHGDGDFNREQLLQHVRLN